MCLDTVNLPSAFALGAGLNQVLDWAGPKSGAYIRIHRTLPTQICNSVHM